MSKQSAHTAFLGLGGTSKNVDELYNEIYELRIEEDELYKEILKVRAAAMEGVKDKDGKVMVGADGEPVLNEAYYGPRGAKLMKRLIEMAARTANRVGKVKKAYAKEVAEHKKMEEEKQKEQFKSVKDIRNGNKNSVEDGTGTSCGSCGGTGAKAVDEENVQRTMDLVRNLLNMT
jgi:hypothetical protein